jgi:hypothetical protein
LLQWTLYKMVLEAGPQGYSSKAMLEILGPGRKAVTLRTCIHSINQVINPMKLAGRGGRYFLERVNWSEEGKQ